MRRGAALAVCDGGARQCNCLPRCVAPAAQVLNAGYPRRYLSVRRLGQRMYGISSPCVGGDSQAAAATAAAAIDGIEVKWSGPDHGKIVVATREFAAGDTLWREAPLGATQSSLSRADGTMVCRHTLRFLGTMGTCAPPPARCFHCSIGRWHAMTRCAHSRTQGHSYRYWGGTPSRKKRPGAQLSIQN